MGIFCQRKSAGTCCNICFNKKNTADNDKSELLNHTHGGIAGMQPSLNRLCLFPNKLQLAVDKKTQKLEGLIVIFLLY